MPLSQPRSPASSKGQRRPFRSGRRRLQTRLGLDLGPFFTFWLVVSGWGACQEARLLWEEGLKSPATAMGTGSFRHGPQEMVNKDARFGMWIDGERMRGQDLAVARDLRNLGASVMLIGRDLPKDAGDLVFQLPDVPPNWQFLIDIVPAQLA